MLQQHEIKQDRLNFALDKLWEMGYKSEIDYLSLMDYKPLVKCLRGKQRLTERGWNKISHKLIAIVQDIRDEEIQLQRMEKLRERLKSLRSLVGGPWSKSAWSSKVDYEPRFEDVVVILEVQRLIEDPTDMQPAQLEKTLSALLPVLSKRWSADVKQQLTDLLEPLAKPTEETNILASAIAFFACTKCNDLVPHHLVLRHDCLRSECLYPNEPSDEYRSAVDDAICWDAGKGAWSISRLAAPPARLHTKVAAILALSGRDPFQVTWEDMSRLDVYVTYPRPNGRIIVKVWHEAIKYEWKREKRGDAPCVFDGRVAPKAERARKKHLDCSKTKKFQGSCCLLGLHGQNMSRAATLRPSFTPDPYNTKQ
ncbi:hypothetical protein POSPLADRAFT_1133294 [Postia placenta MAD-698-R-SB12]|uniref:Uncharacterized protein n=1 Tax=Postia placenta MAD-698-R-SB12 TaxID=670580 RepID=A0A1X6ND75_9APHY|nr:hypothetical protein POSPLADRAFT_1133294 [Postia placenta MAD-698-R-SB12]OSX66571.1 hypothetical protein POSPLADRAFT_1133294 [Postia placenta MAD-698-R-SB12]